MKIYRNGVLQGGSSGIPGTPADVLLDGTAPNSIVILNGLGVGGTIPQSSIPDLPAAPASVLLNAAAPSTIVALDGSGVGTQLSYAATRTAIEAAPGATVADDPGSATGWTTTPSSDVTVSRAGTVLTIAAAPGTTGTGFVTRDASPLAVSATSWDVAFRLDVTAGDGMGSPRGFLLAGFYTDANNFSLTTLRSDRYVGLFVNAAGSFTNVAEVVGPSSGDLTGGQFWLRNTRCDDGRFVAWWGVGVGGELPTLWRRIGVRDDNSLPNALGTTTRLYIGSGAYGEGAIGSAWTVDVLAIRTTSTGAP